MHFHLSYFENGIIKLAIEIILNNLNSKQIHLKSMIDFGGFKS